LGDDDVGGMSETAEEELFDAYRFYRFCLAYPR
jgi:hypothetical protein